MLAGIGRTCPWNALEDEDERLQDDPGPTLANTLPPPWAGRPATSCPWNPSRGRAADHRRRDALVAEELPGREDVPAVLEQVRGDRASKRAAGRALLAARGENRAADGVRAADEHGR